MSSETRETRETRNTGRRRSRRSGKYSPGGNRSSRSRAPQRKPEPKTFWQKIVAFFKGEPEQQTTKSAPRNESRAGRSRIEARGQGEVAERPPRERKPRGAIRKPEAVEVTSPRIYVGNLSFDATESDLFELFNGVGLVQNVEVVCNKATMRSKGFAFVQMQTIEEAKRAVDELHDKEYMGRKLVVSGAKADDRRPERDAPAKLEASNDSHAGDADAEERAA